MPGYKKLRNSGVTFVFKYDEVDDSLLHIYARHMCGAEDAISVFFEAEEDKWNSEFERYESQNDTHVLYWFWIDEPTQVVMVISCFRR
ncbi:MAG: hypothetical protein H6677_24610 [Candidatus Obscuribacterales bacterium]|nr:hypothetical protein [Candidatus Obscuribacterales bacterium]